jgi:SAM-dependent methyltransferase
MSIYGDSFFDEQEQEVLRSARVVVPLLIDLVAPQAVVDVGCGRGAWLSVFREHGVARVHGLDGEHVNRARLLIDEGAFAAVDLARPFDAGTSFDLALCLEVVEHLPHSAGPSVVSALAAAAPVVLFSAAIPGQGGTGHVNERWPRYWEGLFARVGYVRVDAIRRHVSYDTRVKWWYRQNIVLYASSDALANLPALRQEHELIATAPLEWIHVRAFERYLLQTSTLRGLVAHVPRAARAFLAGKAFRGPNDPA